MSSNTNWTTGTRTTVLTSTGTDLPRQRRGSRSPTKGLRYRTRSSKGFEWRTPRGDGGHWDMDLGRGMSNVSWDQD